MSKPVHVHVLPIAPGFMAEYHLKIKDGTPVISEVRVVATDWRTSWYVGEQPMPADAPVTGDGITARVLRSVPLGPEVIARILASGQPLLDAIGAGPLTFRGAIRRAPRKPGSHGRPDLYYAQLAQLYVERLQAGSRSPVADIRRSLSAGGRPYSHEHIRDQLTEARRRGLLTRPPRGKAGGALTPRAIELLTGDPPS